MEQQVKQADRDELLEKARTIIKEGASGKPQAFERLNVMLPDVRQLADSGDPDFQDIVGAYALEFQKDYEMAYQYLSRAAQVGSSSAQRALGYMLSVGVGVEKNLEEAAKLYQSAADAGDAAAKFNLAGMYLRGDGVPESEEKGLRLLEEASTAGVAAAANQLADLKAGIGDYIGMREILERVVPEGKASHRATKNLMTMCYHGRGGNVDKIKALGCCMRMLDMGDGDGMHYGHSIASEITAQEIRESAAWARTGRWAETFIEYAQDR
ncbi:tetratricopeptide repeat protein [Streptomyces sp. NBC_00996]|uniref:tetratricopeptide repeat protein n=1 Tax=Streptomyces sp. NBC_00996 TaxID=2903710 RepID=UPI00386735BA|nr:sel1 repeat family protein [Streptomyces sp. NBC_00996]